MQSESHKSESEEAEEEADPEIIGVESEGPTPCKQPRKQRAGRPACEGSSTEGTIIIHYLSLLTIG